MRRKQYTRQFKLEALELAKTSGKSWAQVERDLGLTQGRLYDWHSRRKREGAEAFPGSDSDAELRRLQRENDLLRQERDILKKALAIVSSRPLS